jgi:hypothetical protein
MKQLKNLINDENKTRLIEVLSLLIVLWFVLYLVPELFSSLFNSILGNFILLTILLTIFVLTLIYDVKYGIIVSIIFIIIYIFSQLSSSCRTIKANFDSKEGFSWNRDSTQDFLKIQRTINRQKIFDVKMIQENQASQEELNYFNKNGMWPWSQHTMKLYEESQNKNPYIRTFSKDSINYTRTVYNEAAILRILSYQTKEGQFLLNGVLVSGDKPNKEEELPNGYGDFAYKSGLLENRIDDVIKCNMDNKNGSTLERTVYTGKGSIYGEQTSKVSPVDYNDLEDIIPGFTFLNGPCNPCGAINENPDYSCPFKLQLKDNPSFISNVWSTLWN